jgi:hypothetical protein
VRFAATEVRLELHNGIGTLPGDPSHGADQQLL